ncbi:MULTISPECIES: Ger(x)C family spore germination protein [Sutcliffiella]|uniref:Ger(x)C family spore germination protein n=1 Tax=Sutcliffiella TaxID=2837511 RepID=UPI0022DD7DD4|nr:MULTISPECIES: Ger(x)C family spore germination protein [Sutcliffiella]MED4015899.1 Ger(x)C family spore germination protein [Sutcliffiella cohnii]WBL14963.1 Ger(x)C family spore germination protein [Sutcliffiella sp. NC1]
MIRRSFKLSIPIIICILLTSCWNAREITDLSIISAVGVDKTEDGKFNVSFQIINAGDVATGQEGASRNASPTVVYSEQGDTLFEAIRRATKKISRRIYFPHTNVVIIGEEIAREDGVKAFLDWFERDHEFRTNVDLVIARGSRAEDVLKVQTSIERVPAKKIVTEIATTERSWGGAIVSQIGEVISDLMSDGKEVVITGVHLIGDIQEGSNGENLMKSVLPSWIEVSGIGLFKEGNLIHWLDGRDARGYNWVVDNVTSTVVNLDCEARPGGNIAIELIRSRTIIKTEIHNGAPIVNMSVTGEGNIGELSCPIDLLEPTNILKLEKQLNEEIKGEIERTVNIIQELGIDSFGFGSEFHRQHPKEWKELKNNWDEIFPTVKVNVEVDGFIRRTGMNNNNFLIQ